METKRCANTEPVIESQRYQQNAKLEGEKYEWGKFRRRGSISRTIITTRNIFIHGWNYKIKQKNALMSCMSLQENIRV